MDPNACPPIIDNRKRLVASSAIGLVFGFALQKARMFDPSVIQAQLLLTDFTMFQTFLAALGTAQLLIGSACFVVPEVNEQVVKFRADAKKNASRGYNAVMGGSTLLGVGIALGGCCPGTLFAQLGSDVPGSRMILYGAIAGIALHSLLESKIKATLDPLNLPTEVYLDEQAGVSYQVFAVASGVLMLIISSFMSLLPNSTMPFNLGTSLLTSSFWSPQLAGALIGSLSLPTLMLLNEQLGMSSSLVSATSLLSIPLVKLGLISENSEWSKSRTSMVTKAVYATSVLSGAMLSALLGETYGFATGLTSGAPEPFVTRLFTSGASQAFIAGLFLWFGARVAGGCTSGHGIGGFSYLKKTSVAAVPSMFAGGIAAMMLLKWIG